MLERPPLLEGGGGVPEHVLSKERAACAQKVFQRYLKKGAEVNLTGVNDAVVAGIEAKLANPPGAPCRMRQNNCASSVR